MFILRQTSVKMAVLLHKQATMPFHSIIAVTVHICELKSYLMKLIINITYFHRRNPSPAGTFGSEPDPRPPRIFEIVRESPPSGAETEVNMVSVAV